MWAPRVAQKSVAVLRQRFFVSVGTARREGAAAEQAGRGRGWALRREAAAAAGGRSRHTRRTGRLRHRRRQESAPAATTGRAAGALTVRARDLRRGVPARSALRRGAAAFLQKGLAKNLQAPLWRGRVLQSGKKARPTPLRSQGRASKTGTEENGAASADSRLFPRRVKSGSGKIAFDGFPGCAGAAAEQFVASAAASVQCCPDPIGIAA